MTPGTRDLLAVLHDPTIDVSQKVQALNYGETRVYDDQELTLHPADHILGAAQVLVEDEEGTRIVYTGDFRMSNTPVLEADVLVVEATYGNPTQVRPFKGSVQPALVSLVESALKSGPIYVFGYHGKLQEVMQILHENHVEAPFIVPERVFKICKVCEWHGMRLGKFLSVADEEAREIVEKNEPHVAFYHMSSKRHIHRETLRVCVSGWEFNSPRRQVADREHVVALSDHSDFEGLLQYVRESRPKLVITDNYRVGAAETLAREIERRLAIQAKAMPQRWIQSSFLNGNS